jgi:hypothetical protein
MDEKTLSDLNKLLCYLHDFEVVELVRAHFARFGNDAPPKLLEMQVNNLEGLVTREYATARKESS